LHGPPARISQLTWETIEKNFEGQIHEEMEELMLRLGYANWKAATSVAVDEDGTLQCKKTGLQQKEIVPQKVSNPAFW
jgi:hypothetical protein